MLVLQISTSCARLERCNSTTASSSSSLSQQSGENVGSDHYGMIFVCHDPVFQRPSTAIKISARRLLWLCEAALRKSSLFLRRIQYLLMSTTNTTSARSISLTKRLRPCKCKLGPLRSWLPDCAYLYPQGPDDRDRSGSCQACRT